MESEEREELLDMLGEVREHLEQANQAMEHIARAVDGRLEYFMRSQWPTVQHLVGVGDWLMSHDETLEDVENIIRGEEDEE